MPIQQMIDILRKQDHTIKNVDFWYNDKDPFSLNLVLVLPGDGMKFHFDPFLQRLRIIEVFDLSSITLRYWSQYFNSPSVLPTMQEVLRIFGSTKPLAPAESDGDYQLTYRGITFILRKFATGITGGSREPVEPKSDLLVTRLFIYLGSNLTEAKVPVELPSACYLQNVFLERLEVNRSTSATTDLTLHLVAQDLNVNPIREPQIHRFTRCLTFGDSVQDVLSALGSPSRVFYKTEDKMKIHLPQPHRLVQPRKSDYFFNYFSLGLDILFDAQTHEVMKFVLHTNHLESIHLTHIIDSSKENSNLNTHIDDNIPQVNDNPTNETKYLVTPFSKWSDVRQHLDSSVDTEPVVIYRESKPQQNPFGPTHAYGYQDIIFEIIPSSECIASVTLYTPIHLSKKPN
ncbi:unnamed protein product [Heterobilharzia americana]|nr:unnamed protein product [Heterobilharzia americana]